MIVQIVPGYGKEENALYDYASTLAEELNKRNIETTFSINNISNKTKVLLHYSNYGFDKNGIPQQLFLQIKNWIEEKNIQLFTFFHELYPPKGKPWQKSFWLQQKQKNIYRQLLKLTSVAFCSNEIVYNQIEKENLSYTNPLLNISLFSNIPVLKENISLNNRNNNAVVFGTFGRRKEVFENILFTKVCSLLNINEIIEIGEGNTANAKPNTLLNIKYLGRLPSNKVANYLRENKFAFIAYPQHLFAKSGIFAAYAGNGNCIINFYNNKLPTVDGLIETTHFINAQTLLEENNFFQNQLSENAFNWYHQHNVAFAADAILKAMHN